MLLESLETVAIGSVGFCARAEPVRQRITATRLVRNLAALWAFIVFPPGSEIVVVHQSQITPSLLRVFGRQDFPQSIRERLCFPLV
jgi:hypothetical protein